MKAASFRDGRSGVKMERGELRRRVYDYLSSSRVPALATGSGERVRCTPLEYSFHNGIFLIFTEGGEKFTGLEKKSNVSPAVFDDLRSVRVTGFAEVIEPFTPLYFSHAGYRKIAIGTLRKLYDEGRPMYPVAVHPVKMDCLFSSFRKEGYDSRQALILDEGEAE